MFQDSRIDELLDHPSSLIELPRPACEEMVEFKQVIPYVALTVGRNEDLHIAVYQRGKGGGEARLHSKWSIGFGGHVNLSKETWLESIHREIQEELGIRLGTKPIKFRGYLNLETPTERVHLGLGYTIQFAGITTLDSNHSESRVSWQPYYHVVAMREALEPWSQLLLDDILREHGLQ